MKIKYELILYTFLLLLFSQSYALQVIFYKETINPGDILYIEIKTEKNEKIIKILENGKELPFFRYSATKFHLYTGYDIQYHPENVTLKFISTKDSFIKTFSIKKIPIKKSNLNLQQKKNKKIITKTKSIQNENTFFHKYYNIITQAYFTKDWSYPVKKVYITSGYGVLRQYTSDKQTFHRGIDFRGDTGTTVYAPNDGIIVYTGKKSVRGNVIVINHGMGVYTSYFHLSKIFVKTGQKIKKGAKIGAIGETGLATGPHLHWDVRINNTCINGNQLIK